MADGAQMVIRNMSPGGTNLRKMQTLSEGEEAAVIINTAMAVASK